jgi:hypothetical protein
MTAPAELTGGSVPEPAAPDPPDPAGDGGATGDAEATGDSGAAGDSGASVGANAVANAVAAADAEAGDPDAADPEPAPVPAAPESAAPKPGRARGTSPLAVAAVIVGLIALAGVAVGVLAVATHGFRPKTVIQYRLAAVFSLRPGECLNSAPNGQGVTVLSCAVPHDAEVFATFSLSASSWPGTAAVQSQANNGCLSRFAGYVSPQFADAGLAQEYYYPDEPAWRAGVRTVVCEVSAASGQLTGSVRAPG